MIPNNLKEFRLKAGLTQKQVAKLLGFSNEVSICHWESGKNIPNLINLFKLSSIYKTTPGVLFSDLLTTIEEQFKSNSSDNSII